MNMLSVDEIQDAAEALAVSMRLSAPARMADARLRLTCAALTGITSVDKYTFATVARDAVGFADACLALLYPEVPR